MTSSETPSIGARRRCDRVRIGARQNGGGWTIHVPEPRPVPAGSTRDGARD